MIARPQPGSHFPLMALAYRGESCLEPAPGTRLTCTLARDHEEPFHVAYQVDGGQLVVAGVWPPAEAPRLCGTYVASVAGRIMVLPCGLLKDHDGAHEPLSVPRVDWGDGLSHGHDRDPNHVCPPRICGAPVHDGRTCDQPAGHDFTHMASNDPWPNVRPR